MTSAPISRGGRRAARRASERGAEAEIGRANVGTPVPGTSPAPPEIYPLSVPDALPISGLIGWRQHDFGADQSRRPPSSPARIRKSSVSRDRESKRRNARPGHLSGAPRDLPSFRTRRSSDLRSDRLAPA